jgi:hypothetical protein
MTIRQISLTICKATLASITVCAAMAANADGNRPTLYVGTAQLRGTLERSVGGQTGFVGIASLPSSMAGSLAPGIGTNSFDFYLSRSSSSGGSFTTFGLMLTERIPLGVTRDDDNIDKVPYFGKAYSRSGNKSPLHWHCLHHSARSNTAPRRYG